MLLKFTRRNVELTDSISSWRTLVEETDDVGLIEVIKHCTAFERTTVAYYAIALYRCQFLKWWWNHEVVPQITTAEEWLNVIIALQLYRLRTIKKNSTPLLLTIFKATTLRKLYPEILCWEQLHSWVAPPNGFAFEYESLEGLDPEIKLRLLLVEFATAIPNGTNLLYSEWTKYTYDRYLVWNFPIGYRHHSYEPDEFYVHYNDTTHLPSYTPLLQICRYGNDKDLKIIFHHLEWWDYKDFPAPFREGEIIVPMVMIILNHNYKAFRYFMELSYTIYAVCNRVPDLCGSIIWEHCWLQKHVDKYAIISSLRILSKAPTKTWRKRINMIQWLFPNECTAQTMTEAMSIRSLSSVNPKFVHCTFYHYTLTRPVHPNPEDVLWLETQQPLVSPKADGVYFNGFFPNGLHPSTPFCQLQAEKINLDGLIIYIVFDYEVYGQWDARMIILGQYHDHWYGPYATLGEENRDLAKFLAVARAAGHKMVWWPKGIYSGFPGEAFLYLLSQPPITPYPNDGWVIAGNKGPFWKIKPPHQCTLDLMYTAGGGWETQSFFPSTFNEVVTTFPEAPVSEVDDEYTGAPIYVGVWRCVWDTEQQSWRPHSRRIDKQTANTRDIADQLTTQHKHPWSPYELVKFLHCRPYYSTQRCAKSKEIRKLHKTQKKDTFRFTSMYMDGSNKWMSDLVDLGGGYKYIYKKGFKKSYDVDPYIVSERNWFKDGLMFWADATTLKQPLTGQQLSFTPSDTSFSIQRCIHYFAESANTWKAFLQTIAIGNYAFISMIDADELFKDDKSTHVFVDGSKMIKLDESWISGVWKGRSDLKWVGKTIHEPIVGFTFLRQELEAQGWELKDTKMSELGLRLMIWEK